MARQCRRNDNAASMRLRTVIYRGPDAVRLAFRKKPQVFSGRCRQREHKCGDALRIRCPRFWGHGGKHRENHRGFWG